MSELTREELEHWLHIARSLEQVGHERECETALAYLDRAERAEANTSPALQVTVKSLQAHIEQLRENLASSEAERDALKADLVVSRDVLRELVEAAQVTVEHLAYHALEDPKARYVAAIARAEEALNT